MAKPGTITADMLPNFLGDLARITTPEIAIAVARKFGGRRLYIPQELAPTHPLADLVGRPAALLMVEHFGGDRYQIPAARTVLRWADCHRLRAEGMSHAQISEALGITAGHVGELLAGAPKGEARGAKQAKVKPDRRRGDVRQMMLF